MSAPDPLPPVTFLIEPKDAAQAIKEGKVLMVEIYGDQHQYKKVSVVKRP